VQQEREKAASRADQYQLLLLADPISVFVFS